MIHLILDHLMGCTRSGKYFYGNALIECGIHVLLQNMTKSHNHNLFFDLQFSYPSLAQPTLSTFFPCLATYLPTLPFITLPHPTILYTISKYSFCCIKSLTARVPTNPALAAPVVATRSASPSWPAREIIRELCPPVFA